MNKYHPDSWVIVEIQTDTSKHHRVLAGWVGGWVKSDSWKLSSGIEIIEPCDTVWRIHNTSGSVYVCYKHCQQFCLLTSSIYNSYQQQQLLYDPAGTFQHVDIANILTQYKS